MTAFARQEKGADVGRAKGMRRKEKILVDYSKSVKNILDPAETSDKYAMSWAIYGSIRATYQRAKSHPQCSFDRLPLATRLRHFLFLLSNRKWLRKIIKRVGS